MSEGRSNYKLLAKSIRENSVFDVASITKAIPLAMVTLLLVDQGKVRLDTPVVSLIPAFDTDPAKREVTLLHLLTNTLHLRLPALSTFKRFESEDIVEIVCKAPLAAPPGTIAMYSNASALLLSVCIMKSEHAPLGMLAKTYFFDPLRMYDTTFDPNSYGDNPRVVPTEYDFWRDRYLRGEVHDESTYALQKKYGRDAIGIAGLFATAPDMLTFLQMLLNAGKLAGRTFLSEQQVTDMHTKHFPDVTDAGGLGFALYPQPYMGHCGTSQTFGKTGFTGCMVMADRYKELGLVILSNYHYPYRKTDLAPNQQFRANIADIVFCNRK